MGGNYYFTCATTGEKSKVEYTFGYQRCDDGKVRIFLHHSSVPYKAAGKAAVTKEDVIAVQNAWAGAIKNISKIYKDNGDYVKAAGEAAGQLYAYGKCNVLFKPTKAADHQFRPTPQVELKDNVAIAMGNYYFTCATTRERSKVSTP